LVINEPTATIQFFPGPWNHGTQVSSGICKKKHLLTVLRHPAGANPTNRSNHRHWPHLADLFVCLQRHSGSLAWPGTEWTPRVQPMLRKKLSLAFGGQITKTSFHDVRYQKQKTKNARTSPKWLNKGLSYPTYMP